MNRAALYRIFEVVRKELTQILRSKRSFRVIVITPILQLFIYGYVVTTDIHHIRTVVLDYDRSATSRSLVEKFSAGGFFDVGYFADTPADLDEALDSGRATLALVIPAGYARALARSEQAEVQLLIDGTNSNTATLALNYATGVLAGESLRLAVTRRAAAGAGLIEPRSRVWFNPELRSLFYMVPGVICILLLQLLVPLTAMNIVKEKENGTIEQLVVTPIRPVELILGKTIPFVLVGYLSIGIIITTAAIWYRVPIRGSIFELLLYSGFFILAMLGIGLLISATSQTQQQAMLSAQFFIIPNLLLSGFMFPISSMPPFMQALTRVIPMRYFLVIVRAIFLKGVGWRTLWPEVSTLLVFCVVFLSLAVRTFRKNAGAV